MSHNTHSHHMLAQQQLITHHNILSYQTITKKKWDSIGHRFFGEWVKRNIQSKMSKSKNVVNVKSLNCLKWMGEWRQNST